MNSKDFETVIEEQIAKCKDILIDKAKEYAQDDDRLHNFKNAAGMMGCDPKEALAGMMAKHTISIYDMCRDGKEHTLLMWNEKITDHINYLLLLKAIVMEEKSKSGRLHYFVSPEHKVVKPGDKVEFDCGRSTPNIEALENEIHDRAKRIEDLWTKNLQEKPLNCWPTDPPKPGNPIYLCDEGAPKKDTDEGLSELVTDLDKLLKDYTDQSEKYWVKRVAESLGVCSDIDGKCDDCVMSKCQTCPNSTCTGTLMLHAKTIIEKYILDSEEKND